MKLLPGVFDCTIYHFGEFQEVWRSHSPMLNYLGFQASRWRTIQWRSSDPQGLRVTLEIWAPGLSLQLPDLSIGIFLGVIGHFRQQGRIVEELQHSSRTWHHPVRVFALHMARSTLVLVFISYPAFGGLFCIVVRFL